MRRRYRGAAAAAVAVVVVCLVAGAAGGYAAVAAPRVVPGRTGSPWGRALPVPGALNRGGVAPGTESVSCPSPGNCAAGGEAGGTTGPQHAFVADEVDGRWGPARAVAGGPLGGGRGAHVYSLACPSAGNCSAGGYYLDASYSTQAFVVSETRGRWGAAEEVPGIVALNPDGSSSVMSVSCPSAGNCSAGGEYFAPGSREQAFVVSEVNGRWGAAREVAGALNTAGFGYIDSVSCAAPGQCTAGGQYSTSTSTQAFVISQAHGVWGRPRTVAEALNAGGNAKVISVSCVPGGNCAAAGYYATDRHQSGFYNRQAFVVSETHSVWGRPQQVAGALNTAGFAAVVSVSCAAAGNCSAGGSYETLAGPSPAFVVSEVDGRWERAQEVAAGRNQGPGAQVNSVSCAAPGDCGAGGTYTDRTGHAQAYVVSETDGRWGPAEEVPGTAALNTGGGAVTATVSCAAPGHCTAGGSYTQHNLDERAFVTSQAPSNAATP